MPKYRNQLPQLDGRPFLTDGGLETTLIFHQNRDLPLFAAFPLLTTDDGRQALTDYFRTYAKIATDAGEGFVLESPTWRANADWAGQLGYDADALRAVNQDSIKLMEDMRAEFESDASPMVISGQIGPRGDGYDPGAAMTADEAQSYHAAQINAFADTEADMITAITMTNTPEAIGVVRASKDAGMPCVISFTVETDGKLPTGQPLGEAIEEVDRETGDYPAYFMINCAHPDHFMPALAQGGGWTARIRGLRANASRMSHEELDNSEELDDGDPDEFGSLHADVRTAHPQINVLGGCCGTDDRHVGCASKQAFA